MHNIHTAVVWSVTWQGYHLITFVVYNSIMNLENWVKLKYMDMNTVSFVLKNRSSLIVSSGIN